MPKSQCKLGQDLSGQPAIRFSYCNEWEDGEKFLLLNSALRTNCYLFTPSWALLRLLIVAGNR